MSALLQIPIADLSPETLQAVIEAYILQEGTDYGEKEASLASRVEQIKSQLQRKEVVVVFHTENETCTLLTARAFEDQARR